MDAIERAIRGALEKGNADDRAFREKVYRSVFTALERNIAANPELGAEVAQRRRDALRAKIIEIEQEFIPAVDPAHRAAPAAPPPSGAMAAPPLGPAERITTQRLSDEALEPSFEAARPSADAPEPVVGSRFGHAAPHFPGEPLPGEPEAPDFAVDPSADERLYSGDAARERRRRPWAGAFVAITLLAALAIAGWWTVQTGLLGRPDMSVPNPPAETAEEDFDPDQPSPPLGPGTAAADVSWITVFSPADPASVIAPSGARADIMEAEGEPFIRIRSGTTGEAVIFDVGQGILESIAGRRAVFDLVARAEEGQETQISIECNFGELGDCGRRRYIVGTHRADYLFDVELPALRPGSAGTIAVTSDVENGGKAIDVFEIRVSVSE